MTPEEREAVRILAEGYREQADEALYLAEVSMTAQCEAFYLAGIQ